MHHGVHTGSGRQVCRQANGNFSIKHHKSRLELCVPNTPFHLVGGVSDHRRTFDLCSGASCRWNNDQQRKRSI